jgi:hypothetical protein
VLWTRAPGTSGALLSSEEFASRVGRNGGCHPVHGDEWDWVAVREHGSALAGRVPCASHGMSDQCERTIGQIVVSWSASSAWTGAGGRLTTAEAALLW